jgi:signal transduction histidine kinase
MTERTVSKILVIPTVVVVLVIGGLLYRWSNQVSESTSVRLADSLQMSMANWHLNLYRDFSDIAGALRVDSESSGNLELYARRFAEWSQTTPYRELVAGLYVLNAAAPEISSALRLDPETGKFVSIQLPEKLSSLRGMLAAIPAAQEPEGTAFPRGLAGWKFEPDTPSLVRAVARLPGSWLVVELDSGTIQRRILPDLAKRYFMGVDGLDYMVAVVAGPKESEIVYSSDAEFGTGVTDADGRMDVFGDVTAQEYGSPIYVFHKLSESGRLSGIAASMGTQWFPLLETGSPTAWQLVVRHRRGGALGAFVAEMHRRDLLISFGALSLLLALIAMLILVSFRASRLGRLQMEFVTAVSHELRSPLAIINSAAENISQGVVEGKEQVARYGRAIEVQARRLSRLVEEVLLFAATRDNRHRYDSRFLTVEEVVDNALSGTADLLAAADFTVEREIAAGLPGIRGDLLALSQCLQNLITNAIKYSGGQRWLGLGATVHFNGSSSEIQIRVSDRGIGIAPHDLPNIFLPFFRTSTATAAQIQGTGLGLSVAKNIADAMHGKLTVTSRVGSGTTFTLHLPVAMDAPPRKSSQPVRAADSLGSSIVE